MGFSRQEYCNGLPCLPPGESSRPRIEPEFLMSPVLCKRVLYHQCHLESPNNTAFYFKASVPNLGASLVAQTVKNLTAMLETWVQSLGWEDSSGEGNGYPFQYSCLGNPVDRRAWCAIVHGVSKSQTQLSTHITKF